MTIISEFQNNPKNLDKIYLELVKWIKQLWYIISEDGEKTKLRELLASAKIDIPKLKKVDATVEDVDIIVDLLKQLQTKIDQASKEELLERISVIAKIALRIIPENARTASLEIAAALESYLKTIKRFEQP